MTQRTKTKSGIAPRRVLAALLAALVWMGGPALRLPEARAALPTAIPITGSGTISVPGLYTITGAPTGTEVLIDENGVVLTGSHTNLSVRVSAGITLALRDVSIESSISGERAIMVEGAGCGLFLVGDSTVKTNENWQAGVNVPSYSGNSLTIYGPGSLTAEGGAGGAGIGGNQGARSGDITIRDTTVTATGGLGIGIGGGGAGIGGGGADGPGGAGSSGSITLLNARVTATGGNGGIGGGGGAGIGGGGGDYGAYGGDGADSSGRAITISSSVVEATGGSGGIGGAGGGAGIGGGGGGGGDNLAGRNGGDGRSIQLTESFALARGGDGHSSATGGSGGGGAAIGGGGGAGGSSAGAGHAGGAGGDLAGTLYSMLGTHLAPSSAGGAGGADNPGSKGGNGALHGSGGGGGHGGGGTGADGSEQDSSLTPISPSPYNTTRPASSASYLAQMPSISSHPVSRAVLPGASASFTVAAAGGLTFTSPPLSHLYQWQVSADGGNTWADLTDGASVTGAQAATLTLTGVDLTLSGNQYQCVVMDRAFQDVTSNPASLTVLSDSRDITGFTILGVNGVIDPQAGTITVLLPAGTDVTRLAPTIAHTGASVSPLSGAAQDFTNPVTYTVTAQDGSTKTYTVTVLLRPTPSVLPRTGDGFPMEALAAALLLMGMSLAGMGWLAIRKRSSLKG